MNARRASSSTPSIERERRCLLFCIVVVCPSPAPKSQPRPLSFLLYLFPSRTGPALHLRPGGRGPVPAREMLPLVAKAVAGGSLRGPREAPLLPRRERRRRNGAGGGRRRRERRGRHRKRPLRSSSFSPPPALLRPHPAPLPGLRSSARPGRGRDGRHGPLLQPPLRPDLARQGQRCQGVAVGEGRVRPLVLRGLLVRAVARFVENSDSNGRADEE